MAREAREKLVLDLLQDAWTAANTFSQTPKITFGWFNENVDRPQVTVQQAEEGPVNGGSTGFASMSGDGSGPSQQIQGTVTVNAWAQVDNLGSNSTTSNPRQYTEAAAEEVQRIVEANEVEPTNPDTGNQPVLYLSYQGRTPVPDTDRTKAVYRYQMTVQYGYGPT